MRLVSLEPFITELICSYGFGDALVGVSDSCVVDDLPVRLRLTDRSKPSRPAANISGLALEDCLNQFKVNIDQLKVIRPDLVLTSLPFARAGKELEDALSKALSSAIGVPVLVRSIAPVTFDQVLEGYEKVATLVGVKEKGSELSHKCKAQVMDWADNFYDRMKNKKVTFVSSVAPLSLGGRWIADMIKLCSAISQTQSIDLVDPIVEWDSIVAFKPDVIIVAPKGADMKTSLTSFKAFEKCSGWETLPAVKRGEVVFTEGARYFHSPGIEILDSMGILVSAIAGFESGYITPRDSYFRLRWMEMQRHKY